MKGNRSDGTASSGIASPVRMPRPQSVAGNLPGYLMPTVASRLRISFSTDKLPDYSVPLCCRYSKIFSLFTAPTYLIISTYLILSTYFIHPQHILSTREIFYPPLPNLSTPQISLFASQIFYPPLHKFHPHSTYFICPHIFYPPSTYFIRPLHILFGELSSS